MVSTRGVRYKFSEGERVLCYEPDPTKAKVLYDSKVLEVIESKDKRGRRTVEYLIHFQGWNSSWDRCVSEDFVLKDTEENRQLQRDLAEKSQLQLGAYLYRRERKKPSTSSASAGPSKRPRHSDYSDEGDGASSSSTQPEEAETGDTESSSADASSSQPRTPPPRSPALLPPPPRIPVASGRAHITLPPTLRDRLTFDYHLVVKRGRLSRLPASPCVAQILESYVKWFARAGAWNPTRCKSEPPLKPDWLDITSRLNLVREVADGLRIYFDFILRGHLLYKNEINQYHQLCGQFLEQQDINVKLELESGEVEEEPMPDDVFSITEEDLMSPKMPEYSHLPPDPMDAERSEGEIPQDQEEPQPSTSADDFNEKIVVKTEPMDDTNVAGPSKPRESRPATRSGNVGRRLRSHKSVVSQSENDEPTPSTSTAEPKISETVSRPPLGECSSAASSGSSHSEASAPSAPRAAPAPHGRSPLSVLLDKVAKWQIIPRQGSEYLPCRVYGAIHLARLFVKLPNFLNATNMPDIKLKLILKHIEMFVQYLDEHDEWFGENYYIMDSVSRSH